MPLIAHCLTRHRSDIASASSDFSEARSLRTVDLKTLSLREVSFCGPVSGLLYLRVYDLIQSGEHVAV